MSRRAVLWTAFVLVHVGVAALGFLLPNEPMGDVYRVYEPWSRQALDGRGIVGITEPWVYPQLALIPMILAHAFAWIAGYTVGWAILVTAMDAVAFAVLVGRGRSQPRAVAAGFWLAFIVLLGPVGLYRLDGFTVPLAILACLWLVGRPWVASMLLSVATWMKVWPAALLLAAVIAVRRRGAIVLGAVVVSALTLAGILIAGGGSSAFGFITEQTTRGLQVEAPIATPYLWGALLGIPGFQVYYSSALLTFQVTGTAIDPVIAAMTGVLVVTMVAISLLGAVAAARGARFASLFPVLSLTLVLGFVVANKVGSPQYLVWLVPSLVLGLVLRRDWWRAPAALAGVAAALTQLVYPLLYGGILIPEPVAVTALTLRNLVLIVLFVWMLARLGRLATVSPALHSPHPSDPGGPHADRLLRRTERHPPSRAERGPRR
ncbi:glycosyltransferase family 87 protein [Microbacterium flavum]|uniref:glycosyltransferase family 87 protein n=1 Tax=Microbacterium flavum TaxID=415216 RepID=UPI0024AC9EDB|nr:glycosyltransferase family 87 protein [Microbacterium flavum]